MTNEPPMPPEAVAEWDEIQQGELRRFVAFVNKWPNYRMHAAFGLLGAAIGTVDMMGGDVEGFVRHVRANREKPTPLRPPKGS